MRQRRKSELLRAFELRPQCAYCECELSYEQYGSSYATIDHIRPKKAGGRESRENKTLACIHCNRLKAASESWPAPKFNLQDLFDEITSI